MSGAALSPVRLRALSVSRDVHFWCYEVGIDKDGQHVLYGVARRCMYEHIAAHRSCIYSVSW